MKRLLLGLLLATAGCGPTATASDKPTPPPPGHVVIAGIRYHRVGRAIEEGFPCPPLCDEWVGLGLQQPYVRYDASHVQELVEMIRAAGPRAVMFDFDSLKAGKMDHWHTIYAPDSAQS